MYVCNSFLSFAPQTHASFTTVGIYVPCSLLYFWCLKQCLAYIRYSIFVGCMMNVTLSSAASENTYNHSSTWQPFCTWRQALHSPWMAWYPGRCSFHTSDILHYAFSPMADWTPSILTLPLLISQIASALMSSILFHVPCDWGKLSSLRFAQALMKRTRTPCGGYLSFLLATQHLNPFCNWGISILWDRALFSAENPRFPFTHFPRHPCSKSAATWSRLHPSDTLALKSGAETSDTKKKQMPQIHSGDAVTRAAVTFCFRGSNAVGSTASSIYLLINQEICLYVMFIIHCARMLAALGRDLHFVQLCVPNIWNTASRAHSSSSMNENKCTEMIFLNLY